MASEIEELILERLSLIANNQKEIAKHLSGKIKIETFGVFEETWRKLRK